MIFNRIDYSKDEEWCFDPAASGDRIRCWPALGWQVLVYLPDWHPATKRKTGTKKALWFVDSPNGRGRGSGEEGTRKEAMRAGMMCFKAFHTAHEPAPEETREEERRAMNFRRREDAREAIRNHLVYGLVESEDVIAAVSTMQGVRSTASMAIASSVNNTARSDISCVSGSWRHPPLRVFTTGSMSL